MNEIVSLAKENELQDYKLIYPNDKNLKVILQIIIQLLGLLQVVIVMN